MKKTIFLKWFSFQNYQIRDFNLMWSFAMHLVWCVFIKYIHQIIEDLNALNNICRFMMCYIDWIFHYVMGYKNNEIQYMGMHNFIRVYCFTYNDIQYYQIEAFSFYWYYSKCWIAFFKIFIIEINKIIDNWVTQYVFKPPSLAVNVSGSLTKQNKYWKACWNGRLCI